MLNGTIVKSYMACKRQGWLAARMLSPAKSNPYIQMGTAYADIRGKSKRFGGIEIDEISKKKHIVVKEYKKTFSNIEASKMQLLFYMDSLKDSLQIEQIDGLLISEETDEKISLQLLSENKEKLELLKNEIIEVVKNNRSPEFTRTKLCDYCGHNLYCL